MYATLEPYSPLTSLKIYEKIMYCVLSAKFLELVLIYEPTFKDVGRTDQETFNQRIRKMVQVVLNLSV